MLQLTLFSVLYALLPSVFAGSTAINQTCSQANNRLQLGTYAFDSDCVSAAYCGSDNICHPRGCRKDIFPFGYPQGADNLPPLCPFNQFCPDEEDACQDLVPVGGTCQLNRDDECQPPPNYAQLADKKNGLNYNGSVCLNAQCYWANVTAGGDCVNENTPYIVYFSSGGEEIDIVSRGNCQLGFYCDSQITKCQQVKNLGDACDADKECSSMNCMEGGTCGVDLSAAKHVGSWVYVVVGIAIFGGMVGTLVGLFFLHSKQRDQEREKRIQYWREQNAFRQNIMQMRDTTHASVLSLPLGANSTGSNSARSTIYSQQGVISEDNTPIMSNQQPKGSGLRHNADGNNSDSEVDIGNVVRENDAPMFRSAQAF